MTAPAPIHSPVLAPCLLSREEDGRKLYFGGISIVHVDRWGASRLEVFPVDDPRDALVFADDDAATIAVYGLLDLAEFLRIEGLPAWSVVEAPHPDTLPWRGEPFADLDDEAQP